MRETDAGLERCAIHLLPWLSMVMPSPDAAGRGYRFSCVPLWSNSTTLGPPVIQAWPLRSKVTSNGLPDPEGIDVIVDVTGSTMLNVLVMNWITQILPSGARRQLRREVGIAMRRTTEPQAVTCM